MTALREAIMQAAALIADAIEKDAAAAAGSPSSPAPASSPPPPSGTQKKARRAPLRLPPAPATPPNEMQIRQAERALARAGLRKVGP